jgi:hypothetical protein
MKVAAASKTIPVTNAAMQEYSKISVRALAILLSPCGFHYRALQQRGQKVNSLGLAVKSS